MQSSGQSGFDGEFHEVTMPLKLHSEVLVRACSEELEHSVLDAMWGSGQQTQKGDVQTQFETRWIKSDVGTCLLPDNSNCWEVEVRMSVSRSS